MKGRTVQRTVHPDPVTLSCGHDAPVIHTRGDRVIQCPKCPTKNVVHVDAVITFRYVVRPVDTLPGMG